MTKKTGGHALRVGAFLAKEAKKRTDTFGVTLSFSSEEARGRGHMSSSGTHCGEGGEEPENHGGLGPGFSCRKEMEVVREGEEDMFRSLGGGSEEADNHRWLGLGF